MLQAAPTNKLVHHPAYAKILSAYNDLLQKQGRVNNKKFYEEVILPEIPDYHMQSWYQFLTRYKTRAGIQAASPATVAAKHGEGQSVPVTVGEVEQSLATTMLSNQEATSKLIQAALNISAAAARKLIEDPSKLSPEKAIELGLKAMRAQDSRIHAVGKIREDSREQEKFDRAFSGAQYA